VVAIVSGGNVDFDVLGSVARDTTARVAAAG
jgi:hypothetical protein